MKKQILLTSAALALVATANGVVTALTVQVAETLFRLTSVSYILGLGAIGLFFVGLAYPNESTVKKLYGNGKK